MRSPDGNRFGGHPVACCRVDLESSNFDRKLFFDSLRLMAEIGSRGGAEGAEMFCEVRFVDINQIDLGIQPFGENSSSLLPPRPPRESHSVWGANYIEVRIWKISSSKHYASHSIWRSSELLG